MEPRIHTLPTPEEAADRYLEESGLGFYSREEPLNVCVHWQENPRYHRPTYKLSIDASNQSRIFLPQKTEEKINVEAHGRIWYRDTLEDSEFGSLNYVVHIDLPGFED